MMTPDGFADAVNKGMAEMRTAMSETAERLEAEFRRLADATGMDDAVSADRVREGNEQLRDMIDAVRDEAVRAAGQLSEGMNEMLAEFRRLVEATMPGWSSDSTSTAGDAAAGAAAVAATGAAAKKATAKKSAKKATAKKSTKKTTKKAAKKSAKKAAAKKSTKKTTKKAAKKSTKKAAAKKSTKKSAKKTSKKAAKKATKRA